MLYTEASRRGRGSCAVEQGRESAAVKQGSREGERSGGAGARPQMHYNYM